MAEHLPNNHDTHSSAEASGENNQEYQELVNELAKDPAFDQIGGAIHSVSRE